MGIAVGWEREMKAPGWGHGHLLYRAPGEHRSTRTDRPRASGKFIYVGDEKLYVRGVTYGTFRPLPSGDEFPPLEVVAADFKKMAANGVNAVRTYTVPPRWLLDEALEHGLWIMVGIPVERYLGYLTDRKGAPDTAGVVREAVRSCAGHPAVLCYSIGNEFPASIVRWHGHKRIERHLEELYRAAKKEDPEALITYANYPSTEYLDLQFFDLACFNVFLENQPAFGSYLARLQNLVGNRPLIMGEIGLDSHRNGEDTQAQTVDWQIRKTFAGGCAGAFVYSWTDEWHTGAGEVHNWQFGLTGVHREGKPALAAVRQAFTDVPFPRTNTWPLVSVVVCSYNGSRTIGECLDGIARLEYPNYETIVVDNGSTDETAAIAAARPKVRLIRTSQTGLGDARNVGLAAARGEIVAYIDDDATPDRNWLTYLVHTLQTTDFVAVGGPNVPPLGGDFVARCVGESPGNPVHVLTTDTEAEHIPGCNMAFRRQFLEEVGGFDPRYRAAGDDVDACWRVRAKGGSIGFNPGAMVWHRPRGTIGAFWRQQRGYGRAEALLESKWPEKYNLAGHAMWGGRVYGMRVPVVMRRSVRVYSGVWGSAPFQSIYQPAPSLLGSISLMPEWYLLWLCLAALSVLGLLWTPLMAALPLLLVAVAVSVVQAVRGASRSRLTAISPLRSERILMRSMISWLHLVQPLARLWGRLQGGLSLWRRSPIVGVSPPPWIRQAAFWSESGQPPEVWLEAIEESIRAVGALVSRGGDFDRHDLEIRGGTSGAARLLMAVEEHGGGRQLVRLRVWPRFTPTWLVVTGLSAGLGVGAAISQAWLVAAVFGAVAAGLAGRMLGQAAAAMAAVRRAVADRVQSVATVLRPLVQRG
jgi:GT2 family glycosyltransferase